MDRDGALPDRCVVCNQPAEGYRVRRKLYCSPAAWRIGAWLTPFAALAAGIYLESAILAGSFWPLAVIALVAHVFVRKSFRIELGVCYRHRVLRNSLRALSIACVAAVFLGIFSLPGDGGALILLGSVLGLAVLAVVQSYVGAQAVSLKELSREHAWLSGTGDAFRGELPELH